MNAADLGPPGKCEAGPHQETGTQHNNNHTDTAESSLSFAALLSDTLGYTSGEFVSIEHEPVGEIFRSAVGTPAGAPAYVDQLPVTANIYFGVNPVRGPARQRKGRGTAEDVTRLAALWADLDAKPGGCGSLDVAHLIVDDLSALLGTRPSAITDSGGGLHPYWPVADGQIRDVGSAAALVRRFGRLVVAVAQQHNARVDSVYDLARILRVPGTFNCKHLNGHAPPAVVAYADTGGPLTLSEIAERLDEHGIYQLDGDTDLGNAEPISAPADWIWAESTCGYVATMVDGWSTDTPKPGAGRHQWLLSKSVRLECARRLGCITDEDHQQARQILARRFTWIVRNIGERREPKRFEIDPEAWDYGIKRAAQKTDEQVGAELGDHQHDPVNEEPPAEEPSAQDDTGPSERYTGRKGLLTLKLAEAVMRSVACGFNDMTEKFYTYENGVWVPGANPIGTEIVRLLGNAHRTSHKTNTLDMIRHLDATTRVTGEPVPDYINTPNGMVDWRTGKMEEHSPDYRSTVQLPVDYDPVAQCPAFERFLAEVLPEDCYEPTADSPGFIWELIGYAMYSGNPLHIAVLLYGIGRNGKGTLIRVLKALLGERNTTAVGLHELTDNRFRAATLYGKLANLAGDLDSRWIDNTAAFKGITGGDLIQAEHKFGAAFDFTPWALPIYSANKAFGSADSSEGWHARWVIIPFPHTFTDTEDRGLDAKLQADTELRGIARRGIEALPTLMDRGRLPERPSMVEAKKQFVAASDAVRAWIAEDCDTTNGVVWTPRTNLYAAYRRHSVADGSKTLSAREFYNRVEQISGITVTKRQGVRGFAGIKLQGQP